MAEEEKKVEEERLRAESKIRNEERETKQASKTELRKVPGCKKGNTYKRFNEMLK